MAAPFNLDENVHMGHLSVLVPLILHTFIGYFIIFIRKGLRQKPDLEICYKQTKLICDPRSRPKGSLLHTIP